MRPYSPAREISARGEPIQHPTPARARVLAIWQAAGAYPIVLGGRSRRAAAVSLQSAGRMSRRRLLKSSVRRGRGRARPARPGQPHHLIKDAPLSKREQQVSKPLESGRRNCCLKRMSSAGHRRSFAAVGLAADATGSPSHSTHAIPAMGKGSGRGRKMSAWKARKLPSQLTRTPRRGNSWFTSHDPASHQQHSRRTEAHAVLF